LDENNLMENKTINVKWEGGGDVGPQCFVKDLL